LFLGPCRQQIDLCIVLDASGSITSSPGGQQNWKDMLNFVVALIKSSIIGPNNVQVALVRFGSSATVQFYFNAYTAADQVIAKIMTLKNLGTTTNLADAMNLVWSDVYNASNGARSTASKMTIIVTDGVDNVSKGLKIHENT
jgi:hypothetical protein